MTPKERLEAIQDKLVAQGVIDVKLTFSEGIEGYSIDAVRLMVARVLEAHLVESYRPMPSMNDAYLSRKY